MKPATAVRLGVVGGSVLLFEILCRAGIIPKFTMIPPSAMAVGLFHLLRSGELNVHLRATLVAVGISVVGSAIVGVITGAVVHRVPRVRRALDPLFATYYSIPVWAFYPLLIVFFGLNEVPKVVIAFLYAVVAVIVNTLNGLDRVPAVLLKMARGYRMSAPSTIMVVILPSAAPFIFTGVKLAIAYSFIGVISSEFILASRGIGYKISFAYLGFDNVTLYSLILFLVVFVTAVNQGLYSWEKLLLERRGQR
jgi:NitT/TauT family transport system permease protein